MEMTPFRLVRWLRRFQQYHVSRLCVYFLTYVWQRDACGQPSLPHLTTFRLGHSSSNDSIRAAALPYYRLTNPKPRKTFPGLTCVARPECFFIFHLFPCTLLAVPYASAGPVRQEPAQGLSRHSCSR